MQSFCESTCDFYIHGWLVDLSPLSDYHDAAEAAAASIRCLLIHIMYKRKSFQNNASHYCPN